MQRNAPVRLTSTTRRHASIVRSSIGTGGAPVPALLKSTSIRPNARFVASKSSPTDCGSVTSVGTAMARSLLVAARRAVSASASGRRPASATAYPSASKASAVARPMPEPAPVTIAAFLGEFIANTPCHRVSRNFFRSGDRSLGRVRSCGILNAMPCREISPATP